MELFYILIFLFVYTITVRASSGPTPTKLAPRTSRITKSPEKASNVLIGSKIILEWKFEFRPVKKLKKITLFTYNSISKAKNAIASKVANSNTIEYSPLEARKYLCHAYLGNNGVGSASIVIENIQFNYSSNYGISLQSQQEHLPSTEGSVSVEVVDMVADQNDDVKTVRSWVGHKTLLKCGVIHRSDLEPRFKWIRGPKKEIITDGITTSNMTSILTIDPMNSADFGEYLCEARTNMVTVKQRISVVQLNYSGPPRDVEYNYEKDTGLFSVFWKQAGSQGDYGAKEYKVQTKEVHQEQWEDSYKTEKVWISVNIKSATKLRVCSLNEIGYNECSCSKPIHLVVPVSVNGKPGETGQSNHFVSCQFLVLIMAWMSSYKVLCHSG